MSREWYYVSGFFLNNVILRLSRLFGFSGRNADVTPVLLADPMAVCEVPVPAAARDVILPIAIAKAVTDAVVVPVRRSPQFKLAMRLAYVAKIQRWKNGKKPKPIGKARANLKPKPVVAGKVGKTRGPSLFPAKMKPVTARKPTTRIYIEKKPQKTAEILKFPLRKPLPGAPRLKRAA